MPRKPIAIPEPFEELSILEESGCADESLDPKLDRDTLINVYRGMVLTRKLDDRMILMQRQGQMGTFAPNRGQEAIALGSVLPLRPADWYSPSYRSFGAQLWRGWTVDQLLLLWDGYFEGFALPEGVNDIPMSIVIGSHVPVAVGLALAERYKGTDNVALTNFGDGASSEGDVSESLNFAAAYQAPVIFLCENNHYAISMPVGRQTGLATLAQRGIGFGMPSIRVDGNDVLAVYVACREAVDRARGGGGPTFIEAFTYRMEMHTTADDPKVYRHEAEVEAWAKKDPIARFEKYLLGRAMLDEAKRVAISREVEEHLAAARQRFQERAQANPFEVFDFMYADLPPELEEQKGEYQRRLKRLGW